MSQPPHEPPETEADRRRANIALLVGAVILIGGGIWLVNALLDARDAQICMHVRPGATAIRSTCRRGERGRCEDRRAA